MKFEKKRICPRCTGVVVKSRNPKYEFECLECDEDFFDFECGEEDVAYIQRNGTEIYLTRREMGDIGRKMDKENLIEDVKYRLENREELPVDDIVTDEDLLHEIAVYVEKADTPEQYWFDIDYAIDRAVESRICHCERCGIGRIPERGGVWLSDSCFICNECKNVISEEQNS